jgi:protein SCO1/2
MSKRKIGYILFFGVLILSFYFLITALIPEFSKGNTAPIGFIRPFSFTNQDGQQVTEKDVNGKVYVAEYFFTTCKGICPRMNNNMLKVYHELKDEEQFLILSHTSDPETDSAGRLKVYADSLNVSTDRWQFLTGTKDSLYKVARHMYQIDDPHNIVSNESVDFLHTQFVALVDQNGDVRKIYDALKPSEMTELVKDAKDLLQNPPKSN